MNAVRIGIFDSGVGGLSVLKAVHAAMPGAALHYIADSGHAPYGDRSDAYVLERSQHVAGRLAAGGAQAIVMACNTATAAASEALRAAWPAIPMVGVEPGIKPAVVASRNGRIGVMATSVTLQSPRFARLLKAHRGSASVHLQACTGLALAIEGGQLEDPTLQALIRQHCRPLIDAGVDTVVLGCTHYSFVRDAIQATMGNGVAIIDTASAVARQVAHVCDDLAPSSISARVSPVMRLQTSGSVPVLRRIAQDWLGFDGEVSALADDFGLVPRTGIEPVRPLSRSGGF